jgi:4-amino-4-deoxy-L-arabinose transferase-like glycosyltransferase
VSWVIVAFVAIVHLGLLIYEQSYPDIFLKGDRAVVRASIFKEYMATGNDWQSLSLFFQSHGLVGDYFPQLTFYQGGGQVAVVLFQILLLLLSIIAIFHLVMLLTESWKIAATAICLYALLPHTLVFPHQLVSEAIFIPLVVISFYYLARGILGSALLRYLLLSGVFLGLSSVIRPITILWPPVVAVIVILFSSQHLKRFHLILYVGVSSIPMLVWMSFMHTQTGEFTMGASMQDAPHNLYQKVKRIATTLPEHDRKRIQEKYLDTDGEAKNTITPKQFLSFVSTEPIAFTKHVFRDLVVVSVKSGVNQFTLSYLDGYEEAMSTLRKGENNWRKQWERRGLIPTIAWITGKYPVLLIVSIFGSLLFFILLVYSIVGGIRLVHIANRGADAAGKRSYVWSMIIFIIYIFSVSLVVNAMQSRHRAPFEFILCIFAAVGISRNRLADSNQVQTHNIRDTL